MKEKMLIWMTEMKDKYVLEASCYKPRKSERRMLEQRAGETGNAKVRGAAKETEVKKKKVKTETYSQRKGGRIMMYIGMGLGAAAAAAAIWVGSTFWSTDPDQPKLPATLERTTEAYTAEEESTEETGTEEMSTEDTSTKDTYASVSAQIPIEEGKRLVIEAGDNTLVALDHEGNVTTKLEQAQVSREYGSANAWVVSADQPIAVTILEEGDETEGEEAETKGKTGLYSLLEDRWLIEPEYDWLYKRSDSLWTDSENQYTDGYCPGDLIRADGTAVNEKEGMFMRNGDYIYDLINNDVRDLEGNLLSHCEGRICDMWGTNVIYMVDGGMSLCQDVSGSLIWKEDGGLRPYKRYQGYENWVDSNGAGIITDLHRNRIMDDVQFYQINQDKGYLGENIQMLMESPDKNRRLVQMGNGKGGDEHRSYFYLCDSDYRIVETYQGEWWDFEDPIELEFADFKGDDWALESGVYEVREKYDSGSEAGWPNVFVRIWKWYMDETGALTVKNMWNDETITVDTEGIVPINVTVEQSGAITLIRWEKEADKWETACLAEGIRQDISFSGYEDFFWGVSLETQPNGVVRVFDKETDEGLYYFLEDGTRLPVDETMEVLYVSPKFQVLQDGSKLYTGGYDGKLTQLPVSMEEE